MDITLSRSFAVVTREPDVVREACRLFECDVKRVPYHSENNQLLVSPVNARERLKSFIAGSKKQLLIYEMKLTDPEFIRILNEKISAGVEVRVVARGPMKNANIPVRIPHMRLHVRGIIRDGHDAFLGSMSMRRLELGARREVGILFHDRASIKRMTQVFEADWQHAKPALASDLLTAALDAPAKKVAKVLAKKIAVKPVIEDLLDKIIDPDRQLPFEPEEVAQTVRDAFRDEVHDAVVLALREVVAGVPEPHVHNAHGPKDERHHHQLAHPNPRRRH